MFNSYEDAVLGNFLAVMPDGWSYREIINKLGSEDHYTHPDLALHEFYEDWNTKTLANHIEEIVGDIADTKE